ncbi:inactive leucine-rich repeat receptor-like serine/threonine-protein kinase At1g60630 [Oryza brachyantha]|uniref:inactive leucine-rich repeat receptor-like serine/threonine-protein kinase At1g60630 n=1 Tax=Oryza brachyantha TaxID=4533 RepID=UPI001ADD1335|nr:inactive leucine-rich repeat receptor-like serine/threonine-protein kinase At1g60630 [Oryza brachyantha]
MPPLPPCLLLLLLLLFASSNLATASDADALLALKSALDRSDRLPWRRDTAATFCSSWPGVRQCSQAQPPRVTKLVLENLNLTGVLTASLLAPLSDLRVLSLKSNALTGPIPDALPAALPNLKLFYLCDNRLQGRIPPTLALLHRATVLVLSSNRLYGEIPPSLTTLPRLTSLLLDDNLLNGTLPPLPQPTLRLLNVSANRLSGEIPSVLAAKFNASSFLANADLCGPPLRAQCAGPAPTAPAAAAAFAPLPPPRSNRRRRAKNAGIVAGATVAGVVVLGILVAAAVMASRRGRNKRVAGDVDKGAMPDEEEHQHQQMENAPAAAPSSAASERGREFSWEREGIGKLVFCGGVTEMYSLEELLRASAETLGRGEVGSTYKAVMETGFIVTVKRMREPAAGAAELGRRAEELGRLRHPNVVALRAYFQAKEERLLVYDYYPNGSLFSLLHGSSSRASSKGKPLHWTSCMKIAEDVAAGLVHLHQSPPAGIVHGNLKPSNVLLGPDFESCLTDYGLVPTLLPSHADLASSASVLYRAPETRAAHLFTPASDVYSFGVLLLELLTGKAPFQDLMDLHGDDIPSWVRAVREEETESGGESASAGGAEEKLGALISIAAACVVVDPARRPTTPEVLRMVREARAEAMSSSNSSDRSPARWSDAVQVQMAMGVPRDQGELGLT